MNGIFLLEIVRMKEDVTSGCFFNATKRVVYYIDGDGPRSDLNCLLNALREDYLDRLLYAFS